MQPVPVTVSAKEASGHEATASLTLNLEQSKGSLLVRPDKALYRVGDVFRAQLLSSKKNGDVYVDFIRDGQTILTQSVALSNGRAEFAFPLAGPEFLARSRCTRTRSSRNRTCCATREKYGADRRAT